VIGSRQEPFGDSKFSVQVDKGGSADLFLPTEMDAN
jgi:hypothetical protein